MSPLDREVIELMHMVAQRMREQEEINRRHKILIEKLLGMLIGLGFITLIGLILVVIVCSR